MKFEYDIEIVREQENFDLGLKERIATVVAVLNQRGQDGWELVETTATTALLAGNNCEHTVRRVWKRQVAQ